MGDLVSEAGPRAYSYTALPDRTIRVLTLHGGNPEDPLRGSLESVVVDDADVYEPLSYVWGDGHLTHEIFLPTARLRLTASLYNALRRLRRRNGSRRVWADQICIDQLNNEERSQQVQFMNQIYRNGSHVQVWLGLDEQNLAKEAFDFVRGLAELLVNNSEHAARHVDNLSEQAVDYWVPLKHITALPWFRRGWIVQEIGTRAPATLHWGEAEMQWKTLREVCEELAEYHHIRVKFKVATSTIKYLYRRFIEPDAPSRHDNRFSFIYELHRAGHLQADYMKSVEEVYIDVAVRALTGDNESLITLGAVQHMSLPSSAEASQIQESKLPSWTPDWRARHGHIMSEPTSQHRACGSKKPDLHISASIPEVLSIRGIRIDSIQNCSNPLEKGAFHERKSDQGSTRRVAIESLWIDICGNTNGFGLDDKYVDSKDSSFFAYVQTLSNGCMAIYWQDHATENYSAIQHEEWLGHSAAYLTTAVDKAIISPELHRLAEKGDALKWSRAATGASSNRRFARTTRGYYVMGPQVMEEGDIICVLFGGKMPFCLRPCLDSHRYLLVGECYIHGFMNGEAIEMLDEGRLCDEMFEVV
ncbi:hypothetical protein TsFJ059_005912 [Trichoderma semiorbis]|uniref:Heterokaryon incompatibility domain-containing protein n=1 Tax=Trichoderma semiorbis TaxID=1491008 RepID=A0A9P8KLI8_9HYPO|nr:hypothetical protein TsFJ059_005912 [Trichoderma semiorbis]